MNVKELKELLKNFPDDYRVSAWLQGQHDEVYADLTLTVERDDYQKEIVFKNFSD